MTCDQAREAISARLDGQPLGSAERSLADHLAACAACRAWEADARRIQRRMRIGIAPPVSDETERFVAAVSEHQRRAARIRGRLVSARLGLVAVAIAQLVLAVPVLLLGHDHAAPEHVAHELGAFCVALACGLLVAAIRPRLAAGMVPIVGVVALLLVVTASTDVALGHTEIAEESQHLLDVAGFLLLLRLAYLHGERDRASLLLLVGQGWRKRPSFDAPIADTGHGPVAHTPSRHAAAH